MIQGDNNIVMIFEFYIYLFRCYLDILYLSQES